MAGAQSGTQATSSGDRSIDPSDVLNTTASIPAIYQQLLDPTEDDLLWNPEDPALVTEMGSIPDQYSEPRMSLNAILAALVIAMIAIFGITRVLSGPQPEVEVLSETATPTTVTIATTQPPPTTTTSPSTTTLPPTTIPTRVVVPLGDPIATADLRMGAFGLGEFEFGVDFDFVAARLAATFGAPSDLVGPIESVGQYGTCAGALIHTAQFGQLVIVGVEAEGVRAFQSYRIDLDFAPEPTGVSTISGLKAGDTVGTLKNTYTSLRLQFVQDPEDGVIFQLWRPSDGALLLWGPVTSNENDGIVTGIYSPDSCGRL